MAGKIKKLMPRVVFKRLADLYSRMERAYEQAALEVGLACTDCPDNCCTSYFQHHTRVEWAYFIKGLSEVEEALRQRIIDRAVEYVDHARNDISRGRTPDIMCPVNEDGLCMLYDYRLMICRLHGVPTSHTRPDSQTLEFPGCFRTQKKTAVMLNYARLDRTAFYKELAALEQAFVGPKIVRLSRINLTLAEMIVQGAPTKSQQL